MLHDDPVINKNKIAYVEALPRKRNPVVEALWAETKAVAKDVYDGVRPTLVTQIIGWLKRLLYRLFGDRLAIA